jgi:arabinose-5-phosphate isomerase
VDMGGVVLVMRALGPGAGRVQGIFTDGDLRRSLENGADIASARIAELMTPAPKTIAASALAAEAVQLMERHKINQMLVVDARGALAGALNMHDLFRAKVI